jgi:alanine racemase
MNWITVHRENIIHNFLQHQNYYPGSLIIPVLKSNAYGHGLKQLCLIMDKVPECTMVAVDSYPEYLSVYHNCKKNILLLNETEHKNYKYFDYKRTIPGVYTLDTLRVLIASKKPWRIHLFLNT